ncbi:hypothetical protein GCM10012275_30100 [Longimycelium tulufanense]|uniref:Uncharacterized protein n=1 Tax=Longimycelium tulufanense TaxID=907463 RepID=A0A8J3CF06_9PSEU|nr:hypothetical protein [Longimycelium tulufanense]GGM56947.1 hypothetical protein GCM10012275_30100 [Longimycelium tulufanense]
MGVYVGVRGWLECDEKQLVAIQAIIQSHDDDHYSGGWGTPRRAVNWTSYIFYSADIREQAVDWLLDQLREIAGIPASDADNDLVRGLFLASHEVDGMSEWQVRDGQVFISRADSRYEYLDI